MKKYLSIIFLLALIVSGCSNHEELENPESSSPPKVFTASFEQNKSRTYLDNDELFWNEEDLITVFDGYTYNSQFKFDGQTGDNSGTFSEVSSGNKPAYSTGNSLNANYAIYPYASTMTISQSGVITATLPANQSYAENSFGQGDNTMVAVTKDTDDTFLKFKNVGGYLELWLYGEDVTVKSITLTGNNNEKLAGTATITSTYSGEPTVSMANDATKTITLDCGEGISIGSTAETATAFWFVVPPTTFENGFTISITDIDGGFAKSTSKSIKIERNVIQSMTAIELRRVKPIGNITDLNQVVKGDYAMKDGSFISKDSWLVYGQEDKVAGIVFWTENEEGNASLSTDIIMGTDFPNCTHGLIVALKDISNSRIVWQGTESLYESLSDVYQTQNDEYNPEKSDYLPIKTGVGSPKISGYNNTKVIKAFNTYCINNNRLDYVVKPVETLKEFEKDNPAPINSTGWYIPSLKEIHMLSYKDVNQVWGMYGLDTRDLVNKMLDKISGEKLKTDFYYFSSSECNDNSATGAYSLTFQNGQITYSRKHYISYVRAICAF